ncbi:proprotein convertase P-domain-containing protein [candidate division KSB1 bacterium]|nr:proprotein convertase P-domain-containing protein [candidate division KSB1 bacterium]
MIGCPRVCTAAIVRRSVLLVFLLAVSVVMATPVEQGSVRNPNQIVQKTVIAPDGARYFCEPMSSTIELLDQNFRTVSRLNAVNDLGESLRIIELRFDATLNQLVAVTRTDLFVINTATGQATAVATPTNLDRPRVYEKIERHQARYGTFADRAEFSQVAPLQKRLDQGEFLTPAELEAIRIYNEHQAARHSGDREGLDADGCDCVGDSYASGDVNLAITDNTGDGSCDASDGISSTITVPDVPFAFVLDANITINLNHTFVSDLVIEIIHDGVTVGLWQRGGNSCDNLVGTTFDDEGGPLPAPGSPDCGFTGCFFPQDPSACGNSALSAFDGQAPGGDWTLRVADHVGIDVGTLLNWSVCLNLALLPPPLLCDCPVLGDNLFNSGDINLPIDDNLGPDFCVAVGQISHTISVPPGAGNVVDVNVIVNLTHTFYPDLVMDITHNGVTVLLTSQGAGGVDCGPQTWIFDDSGIPWVSGSCDFNGCVQPGSLAGHACAATSDLNAFNGMNASGDWTFRLADAVGVDVGTLFNWGLCLTTTPPGHVSVDFAFPDFHCVDGALSPNPAVFTMHVTNPGPGDCNGVQIDLSAGGGTGGSATVTGSPAVIGDLPAGAAVDVVFTLDITPSGSSGTIPLSAFVQSSNCGSFFIDFIQMDVPACLPLPGDCNCMDVALVVDVTGSMFGAIANVVAELPNVLATANTASGGDVKFAVLSFRDNVITNLDFTFDQAAAQAAIGALIAIGGAGEPEASDEALRETITHDGQCMVNDLNGSFRAGCTKISVLITDARPGGCDDTHDLTDVANAHQRAVDADAAGIHIAAVYVPTFPGYSPEIVPIMLDYANTSHGSYVEVQWDGQGTGNAISTIIENCGGFFPDDCLPDGADCNGGQPEVYTTVSGAINNAVLNLTETGEMELVWEPVDGAEFYQIYTSTAMDQEENWAPIAFSLTTSVLLPALPSTDEPRLFHVKAKAASVDLIASDIACWPIEEGVGDLVEDFAQDNDGTNHGADWIIGPSGHRCLHFEYGDYVSVENSTEFYGQPLQLDACVSIDHVPTIQTGSYYIFSCHRYAQWFEGFGVRIDVFGRLMCQVWNTNTNSWQTLMAPMNRPVPVGVPFLVTAVINGNNSLLLLNGEVVAAGVQNYQSITNGYAMTIGAHHYNDNYAGPRHQYHMRGDIHWLKIGQFNVN